MPSRPPTTRRPKLPSSSLPSSSPLADHRTNAPARTRRPHLVLALRTRRPRLVVALLLGALITGTTACAADAPPEPKSAAPASAVAVSEFGGTDLAWIELMIPMDEQLIPVLDLLAQRAADPALARTAQELRAVYDAELPRLRTLGQQAGIPAENPHKGHKMPGLVDADRLAVISAAQGAEFDRQAAECLREHLAQLVSLAKSEIQNGNSPTVKAIARSVVDTRTQVTV
ncbi:DUF305 domain-containing protein [Dactylosporangium sucinum]|uniref:DUF305 domain-containing protein n=1 Tax=Dactylosporangium sucinum TaxID=1424081 RepID=A0A917X5C4_9ACTN|nr:DUF305 domain-containing protein [Dactylosporangium sucinum]GGM79470.1 hypothetical protein GCM10007977_096210 [Dactylosporangium sucinum]